MTYGIAAVGAGEFINITGRLGCCVPARYPEAAAMAESLTRTWLTRRRTHAARVFDLATGELVLADWEWLLPLLQPSADLLPQERLSLLVGERDWLLRELVATTSPEDRPRLGALVLDPLDPVGAQICSAWDLPTDRETLLREYDDLRCTAPYIHVSVVPADAITAETAEAGVRVPPGAVLAAGFGVAQVMHGRLRLERAVAGLA